ALVVGCSEPPKAPAPPATPATAPASGFTPTPEQHALPKSLLVVKRTPITRAKFPVIDFHFHAATMKTAGEYEALVRTMDQAGVGVIANMDGGMFDEIDTNLRNGEPFKTRIVHFAKPVWDGINDPGWSEKTAAELERAFKAGALGLKIHKTLGLELQNPDGSYILPDDPRMDAIWAMCGKYGKPVMIHASDPIARWSPIGPDNERYEAGLWRTDPSGNYHGTSRPHYTEIWKRVEHMLEKHPKTHFVLAHIVNMSEDLDRAGALLDRHANADVELSARYHDLGRQPVSARKWLIKYQDRVLFGSDGSPGREIEQFWTPHWRFAETDDEYFDHPAQMLSPLGAPLQGRWRIYGVSLPDPVLRKLYHENALRHLPSLRPTIEAQLARTVAATPAATSATQ
ncbi:MAG TPA: amidohydrolase family protein, partial [Luteitalea sp.]|nr:amidohydrolase family protein [Luteitalea sp.]